MTEPEWEALAEYIRNLADQMNLRDWRFELCHQPCSEDHMADIECIKDHRQARIRVSPVFRDYPPEQQREIIFHELLHPHLEGCWEMVREDLNDILGNDAYHLYIESYRRAMELAVASLTAALARHMPLIKWPR